MVVVSDAHFIELMKKWFNKIFFRYSVFWDLYCAAPERRDQCDHSSEAKAFHDYVCYYANKYCNILLMVLLFRALLVQDMA